MSITVSDPVLPLCAESCFYLKSCWPNANQCALWIRPLELTLIGVTATTSPATLSVYPSKILHHNLANRGYDNLER